MMRTSSWPLDHDHSRSLLELDPRRLSEMTEAEPDICILHGLAQPRATESNPGCENMGVGVTNFRKILTTGQQDYGY